MKPHKWAKEIKAWLDGVKVYGRMDTHKSIIAEFEVTELNQFDIDSHSFYIKPQPCVNEDEPRGCYRVRCQLGKKCVDDEMSHRLPQPKEPQYLYVYRGGLGSTIVLSEYSPDSGRVNIRDFSYIRKIKLEQDDE